MTDRLQIHAVQGSILDAQADVIVNAANSRGIMGGGVAGVIKRAAGGEVEREAREKAPIAVGDAVLTSAGRTGFKGIIHAPTMSEPSMRIGSEAVARATRAALSCADQHGFVSVAIPGMGTGVGGVPSEEAAAAMVQEITRFVPQRLRTVFLIDVDGPMVNAWKQHLGHG